MWSPLGLETAKGMADPAILAAHDGATSSSNFPCSLPTKSAAAHAPHTVHSSRCTLTTMYTMTLALVHP